MRNDGQPQKRNLVGRPPGADGAETERLLRQVATDLFATKGFSGVGIREIAAGCGFTLASLYHYVESKEQLLQRIMQQTLGELTDQARRVVSITESPMEQLIGLIEMSVIFHAVNAQTARVVDKEIDSLSPAVRAEVIAARDAYEAIWAGTLTRGTATGLFTTPHPRIARLALLGMCAEVAYWYSPAGPMSIRDVVDSFVSMGVALVTVNPTQPPTPREWIVSRLNFRIEDAVFSSEPDPRWERW